jgi:hypothetical protein
MIVETEALETMTSAGVLAIAEALSLVDVLELLIANATLAHWQAEDVSRGHGSVAVVDARAGDVRISQKGQ